MIRSSATISKMVLSSLFLSALCCLVLLTSPGKAKAQSLVVNSYQATFAPPGNDTDYVRFNVTASAPTASYNMAFLVPTLYIRIYKANHVYYKNAIVDSTVPSPKVAGTYDSVANLYRWLGFTIGTTSGYYDFHPGINGHNEALAAVNRLAAYGAKSAEYYYSVQAVMLDGSDQPVLVGGGDTNYETVSIP